MVLGKLDSHMQKNETGRLPYTIHKNKLKMDERSKCETGIHQNPGREHKQQHFLPPLQQLLAIDTLPKARETNPKMTYCDFIRIKAFAQQRKQLAKKLRDSPRNGRRYLQMTL